MTMGTTPYRLVTSAVPAMRWIVGGKAIERQADLGFRIVPVAWDASETELLATDENVEALVDM